MQLQEVLQEVVRRTVATEEEILRRIRAHAEPGVGCGGESSIRGARRGRGDVPGRPGTRSDPPHKIRFQLRATSLTPTEAGEKLPDSCLQSALTDEGVGLSQKPWQSLFSGLGLGRDPQVEEAVLGVSARLCSVVRKLLDLSQLEPHPPRTQVPLEEHLIQSGPDSAPSQLQEYRPPEQLHRGPAEFGAVERAALEEVLQQKEAQVQELVEELQRLDAELQELREERALLLRQREALAEPLGDTERALLEEAQRLLQEAQRQAEEDRSRLASRLRLMEVEVEERDGGRLEAEEQRRAQVEDLRLQVHALEKQLRHHRQFIDEQAVEREQEREEFQQEIQRLEARLRRSSRPRPGGGGGGGGGEEDKIEDLVLQVENLRAAIRQKSEDCERLLLTKEKYRGDVAEQNEQIHTMAARICELERALLDTSPSGHALAPQDAAQDRAPLLCSSCLQVFARSVTQTTPENDHAARPLPEADGHEDTPSVRLDPRDQLEEQRREILRLRREADASQDQAAAEARAEVEELRSQVEHLRSDRERLRQDREVEEERLHEVIHKLQEELERAESTRYELSTSSESSPAPPSPHPRGLEHSLRQELSRYAPVPEPRGEAHAGPGGTGAQKRGGDAPDGPVPAETLRTVLEALEGQVQEGQAKNTRAGDREGGAEASQGPAPGGRGRTTGAGDLREVLTVAEETLAKAEVALRENEERLAQGRAEREALKEEHEALKEEHDALKEEHEALKEEHEAMWAEHDAMKEEHEALWAEHDAMKEEHEALKEEHEALKEEHDALWAEHDARKEEHEARKAEHEALKAEHEVLWAEHEALKAEHEALKAEPDEALKEEHEALKAEHEVLWAEHVSLKMKFAAVQEELSSSAHRTETLMEESQTEDRALADLDIHSQLLGLAGQQGEPESRSLQGDACTRHGAPGRGSFLSGLRTPLTLSASASEPSTGTPPPRSPLHPGLPLRLGALHPGLPLSEQVKTLDERYFTGLEEWPSDADCSSVSSHRDTTLQEQWGAPEGLSASFLEYLHNRDMSVAERTDSATESMGQDAELLSPELQSWLKRVYREGHRVLSLSERPVPVTVTTPSPHEAPPPSWQAERRALQQTVLSLRELLCKMAAREPKEEQWLRDVFSGLCSSSVLRVGPGLWPSWRRCSTCAPCCAPPACGARSSCASCRPPLGWRSSRGEGSQCRHGELLEPHLTERQLGRTDQPTTQRAGGAEQKAQLWAEQTGGAEQKAQLWAEQTGGAEQKAQLWGEEQKAQLWEGLVCTEMSQEAERHQQSEQSHCEALIAEENNQAIDHARSLEEEERAAGGGGRSHQAAAGGGGAEEAKGGSGEHKAALGLEEQRRRANQLQAQLDLLREEARSVKEERRTLRRQEEQEKTERKHSTICHRLSQSAALQADGCNAETELQLSVHMANQPYNSKVQRLYCRYLRSESHRKALAFQKRYLLLLLGGALDGQHATLALVALMGALSLLVRKWRRAFRTGPPDSAQTTEHSSRAGSSIKPEVLRRQQPSAVQSSASKASAYTQHLSQVAGFPVCVLSRLQSLFSLCSRLNCRPSDRKVTEYLILKLYCKASISVYICIKFQ
ncbi:hypothetical protein ANANG_G00272810 [Anguilla anguilla]|uniref:Pericentrin/AKAP-450 centrosomal targeting domain-containing protein n=1 Tax=Anguilla anguilla TaxID=7936 RepID=A0A9D3LMV0_ANGAN|nr:hypothetical protein ANANG_G00272810 [Anguilla anguilla]